MTRRLVFLSSALLALSCADPTAPVQQDQLLLVMDGDIYRMNADGTGAENLTKLPARYGAMDLSPDGKSVVFYSDRDIFLIHKDKTGRVNLTNTPDKDESLALWLRR